MTEERPADPMPPTDDTIVTPPPVAPAPAPSYTPPPIAPPAPQPTVAWAPPPAGVVTTGKRTTLSLAAGIILAVLGIFGGLIGLAIMTIGREVVKQFDFTNMPGVTTGGADVNAIAGSAVTFVGILLLVFSAFYIIGGVGIMRSAGWGRVIGIIVGILGALFWMAGVAGGSQPQGGGAGFSLVLLAIHAYVAVVLILFWRTKSAA